MDSFLIANIIIFFIILAISLYVYSNNTCSKDNSTKSRTEKKSTSIRPSVRPKRRTQKRTKRRTKPSTKVRTKINCQPGEIIDGVQCKSCEMDTYMSQDALQCLPCPSGKTTNGKTKQTKCVCEGDKVLHVNGDCISCPDDLVFNKESRLCQSYEFFDRNKRIIDDNIWISTDSDDNQNTYIFLHLNSKIPQGFEDSLVLQKNTNLDEHLHPRFFKNIKLTLEFANPEVNEIHVDFEATERWEGKQWYKLKDNSHTIEFKGALLKKYMFDHYDNKKTYYLEASKLVIPNNIDSTFSKNLDLNNLDQIHYRVRLEELFENNLCQTKGETTPWKEIDLFHWQRPGEWDHQICPVRNMDSPCSLERNIKQLPINGLPDEDGADLVGGFHIGKKIQASNHKFSKCDYDNPFIQGDWRNYLGNLNRGGEDDIYQLGFKHLNKYPKPYYKPENAINSKVHVYAYKWDTFEYEDYGELIDAGPRWSKSASIGPDINSTYWDVEKPLFCVDRRKKDWVKIKRKDNTAKYYRGCSIEQFHQFCKEKDILDFRTTIEPDITFTEEELEELKDECLNYGDLYLYQRKQITY